mmetsp:Transcript_19721/g.61253  ORF Transcript_19721/g.61253 Transcript_19721/m.61253 type:complete len:223 (-) Transcript_19721:822-1490(-)
MNSGMMSSTHSGFSRSHVRRSLGWYCPGPPFSHSTSRSVLRTIRSSSGRDWYSSTLAGISAVRRRLSRFFGCAQYRRFCIASKRAVPSFCSARCLSSSSHASVLRSPTPTSVSVEVAIHLAPDLSMASMIASCSSGSTSSSVATSLLLKTMTSGFPVKSGRMEWNRLSCCAMVYPHWPDRSMKKRIAARRCASAVMACISTTLRSSSAWSRIPGVSITCHTP